ncbi:hypothetical protein, partial [Flavobacterium sp.]
SCILLQLGFKHYIRKIKQPMFAPESFTHVYVIVPVDQNTGSLKQGYYTIDGTLPTTQEPNYIETKDFFMDKLSHIGLNGATQPLNGFSFADVKTAFNSPISCWGGSAFSGSQANAEGEKIGAYFENLLNNINVAVRNQNLQLLQDTFLKYEGILFTSIKAYERKKSEGWNKCTTDSITRMQSILNFYDKVVHKGLTAWLSQYFTMTPVATKSFNNGQGFEDIDPTFKFTYTDPAIVYLANIYDFKLKQGVTAIPEFEFTPYVEDMANNPSAFDPATFLQGLSTVLVSFNNPNNGNTGTVDENGNLVYDTENTPKTTSNAGAGYLLGGLVLIGLASWGFSKMKDTGKKVATKK